MSCPFNKSKKLLNFRVLSHVKVEIELSSNLSCQFTQWSYLNLNQYSKKPSKICSSVSHNKILYHVRDTGLYPYTWHLKVVMLWYIADISPLITQNLSCLLMW